MAQELFEIIGVGAMRLAAADTVVAPTDDGTAQVGLPLDTVSEQRAGITCDPATATITIPDTGVYRIPFGLNATYSGELNFYLVVNGVRYNANAPFALQGRNARPVAIGWENMVQVNAGDTLQLVMAGDGADITVNALHAHFSVTRVG